MGQHQKLLNEPLLTVESSDDLVDVLASPMVGFQILLEKLDEAPDGRERRAYLVSDPGRQRAEKRELICTLDLLANAPLLRRVTEQQHERLATVMVLRRHAELIQHRSVRRIRGGRRGRLGPLDDQPDAPRES